MRTLTFAAVAATVLLAASANAADAPYSYNDTAYAPAMQETWSGFYVGGIIGYGWGEAPSTSFGDFEPDGFLGGLTVGMNHQLGSILLGAEADFAIAGISEEGAADFEHDFLGTVRGRIGYAFDRFVLYGTGGFAWTNAEIDEIGSESNFHGGWTLGAGIEAAVTGNVSVKAEYLYMDFTDEVYSPGGTVDPDLHTIRFGVNYKF